MSESHESGPSSTRASGLFFLHVMKTGGTSASDSFARHYAPSCYPSGDPGEKLLRKSFAKELLALSGNEERSIRFLSVHMGAGIIDHLTPGRVTCTVLRDPVARAVSHLRQIADSQSRTLEAVYDDPVYQSRLSNYQTRILSTDLVDDAPSEQFDADSLDSAQQADLLDALRPVWATAIQDGGELTATDLKRALDRLDTIDVVGTNERLAEFVERVSNATDVEFAPPLKLRVSSRRDRPSASLLERLEHDNQLDTELYQRALDIERHAT